MILEEKIFELIYTQTGSINWITDRYDTFVPDEAVYPFLSYNTINTYSYEDFTPRHYDVLEVQFDVFNDNPSPEIIEKVMQQLECIFHHNTSLAFTGETDNYQFVCSHKIKQFPTRKLLDNDKSVYWIGSVTYSFKATRDITGVP